MASQTKNIRVFKKGLNALIEACEFRISAYKSQMHSTSNEDDYADLGNDCNVLCSVLELLKATDDEWNNEIADDVNEHIRNET